ncbi:hypothetical protein [Prevotella sp. 10(H)]|uniref:hypothetical protein n=1 Tax=Prevotella sp. 10(H) TaxID=1158294 RepID=UPI0004A7773F|nr:hypothetical protein [Prevotella sp. 10(H)]
MILYFNPGHETAVINASPYYMAPANVVSMQNELGYLPAWYGTKDDVTLLNRLLDADYCSFLHANLSEAPKAVIKEQLSDYCGSEISLWGISPQAIHFFNELNSEYETGFIIPAWKEEYSYLNSRLAAKDCLEKLVYKIDVIQPYIIPQIYTNVEEIENAVKSTDTQLLAKAPYSSSGRGLLWLPQTGLTRTERQILHGILKKQNCVTVEKVLDKQTDFAMEFMCDGKGNVQFEGYSLFYTNKKGVYESNFIGSQEYIEGELISLITLSILNEVRAALLEILKEKYASVYKGCIGVDMMIYKENNEYKIQPCVEINMRYNMGFLALKLYEKYISQKSFGKFYLDFSAKAGEIHMRHIQAKEQYPASFENGRLRKGYMPLCPVNQDSRYWAYIIIES